MRVSCYSARPRTETCPGYQWLQVSTISKGWWNNYTIDVAFVDPTWIDTRGNSPCATDDDRMLHEEGLFSQHIEKFKDRMKEELPRWRITVNVEKPSLNPKAY